MHGAWRTPDASHLALYRVELAVLAQSVSDVADRVRPETVETDDPFALWEWGDDAATLDEDDDDRDPLLDRLFPNVHPDDPRASADHRRFSEADLRRQKAADADVVLGALFAARLDVLDEVGGDEPVHHVEVRDAEVDAWLRALNTTRLALAMDLGIETPEDADELEELDADDERIFPWSVYEFLGETQSIILALVGYE